MQQQRKRITQKQTSKGISMYYKSAWYTTDLFVVT